MRQKIRPAQIAIAGLSAGALLAACSASPESKTVDATALAGAAAGEVESGALEGVALTYVAYGGSTQDQQTEAWLEPFAKESGARVLQDGPTENAKIKAQVESGNVTWDVLDVAAPFVLANCGTLFEKIDYEIVNTSELLESTPASDCAVPMFVYGYGYFYNVDKYGDNPPQDWNDFFDTERFPGTRGVNGLTTPEPGSLEAALIADGVPIDELYPLDLDRAISKWDSIRDDIKFWQTGAEITQMALSGEADMIFAWNGRVLAANREGANFAPVYQDSFTPYDVFAVPMGAPNKNAAMALINYSIGAEQQSAFAEVSGYSSVNKHSKPELDEMAEEFNVTDPEVIKKTITPDMGYWGERVEEITTAYSEWLNS